MASSLVGDHNVSLSDDGEFDIGHFRVHPEQGCRIVHLLVIYLRINPTPLEQIFR